MTIPDRSSPLALWIALGAGGAVLGLLPWLSTGGQLLLQNLGDAQQPGPLPFVLLPFNQYFLFSIVALLVVGPAITGLVARALAPRRPRFGTLAMAAAMVLVQVVAIVQSAATTASVLETSTRASLYLGLLIAVSVIGMLVGVLVLLLVARAPVPGATIALALAAIVASTWVGTGLRELLIAGPEGIALVLPFILRWMPAVLVGCAIAWCGFRTPGRIVAAVVSLAALWIGPAVITAVSSAAGTRVLLSRPAEMAEYGIGVFGMALTIPEIVAPSLVVAAVIGVVGAVVLARLRRADIAPTGVQDEDATLTPS
ncbi:hypothetical protein OVN20_03235 [Microcella daejeonensis]|uniref:hypothetical protein n=1 Tax=Microcella daejeonensis TaxID=2994971 RepID=UPI00226FCBBD|nr:hypothetical protein [Microcella daejeonensis]WAB84596.1 hypothetical protein OVN20_03235 [Microcella daejeonensis]